MDQLTEIHNKLNGELTEMNAIIRESLLTGNDLMNRVVEGYLLKKGKQIRPILVLLSAKVFGEVNVDVLHSCAALEMLHNATLIHDDVVDETLLRRGQPTINKDWGNQIAVLAGDYFVANALAVGIRTGNIAIISALSDLGRELSLGEVDQICNARNHCLDEASYFSMIRRKTASLFSNCVKMGAEAVGASPDEYGPLVEYADIMGLCFQIKDDIFDYFNDGIIGKPTGNDLREGKVTLPLLYALSSAPEVDSARMKALLEKGDLMEEEIAILIEFAKDNGGVEYAYFRMTEMKERALPLLEKYPQGDAVRLLADLFSYIISRSL